MGSNRLLKTLILDESITAEHIVSERDQSPCAPNADLTLIPEESLFAGPPGTPPSFGLWIDNPTSQPVPVCILRTGVVRAPRILVVLKNANGEALTEAQPEVYPDPGRKVEVDRVLIPPMTRVLVKEELSADIAPRAKVTATWSIWLNGEFKSGSTIVARRKKFLHGTRKKHAAEDTARE